MLLNQGRPLWLLLGLLPFGTPLLRHRRVVAWCIALASVVLVAGLYEISTLTAGDTGPVIDDFLHQDCDTALILDGLEHAPHFADTLRWWTGRWVGQVPFWRPGVSLLYWIEWKLFGTDFRPWAAVSVLLAAAMAAAVLWALEPLIGLDGAVATVLAAFSVIVTPWARTPLLGTVMGQWKHQADELVGIALMLGLGLVGRGKPLWGLVPVALACVVKENGFFGFGLLPVVAGWLLWRRETHLGLRKLLAWTFAVALPLLVWRCLAVGVGYRMGTNRLWWRRAMAYMGGHAINVLFLDQWHVVALVVLAGLFIRLASRRGVLQSLLICAAGVVAVLLLRTLQLHYGVDVVGAMLFVEADRLVCVAWWLIGAYMAVRFSRREVELGAIVLVIGALPTFIAATQTQENSRWLGAIGHAVLAWAAIRGLWEFTPRAFRETKAAFGFGRVEEEAPEGGEPAQATETQD
jgi:hypothetical protein